MITTTLLASVALAGPSDATARVLEGLELSHELRLEKTGAEPRRVVRFRPTPGKAATYEMKTTQDVTMSLITPDGQAMPMPGMGNLMPTVVMRMSSKVGEPLAAGVTPVTIAYEDARVEGAAPEVQAQIKQSMQPMLGTGFRCLVDDASGRIRQVDVSTDDEALYGALQGMADQFVSQLPQFPEEPVGVGAQWTVTMDMSVAGMDLIAQQTMTVTELGEHHIATDTVFALSRGDAPMQLPGLPPGAQVDFERFEGSGKGHYDTDLTTMASSGSMTMDLDLGMAMQVEGQSMKMSMDMTQKTQLHIVD